MLGSIGMDPIAEVKPHCLLAGGLRPGASPALARVVWSGDGNLLSLLPAEAYRRAVCHLGDPRRSILIVNEPELLRDILLDPSGIHPEERPDGRRPRTAGGQLDLRQQRRDLAPPTPHGRSGVHPHADQPGLRLDGGCGRRLRGAAGRSGGDRRAAVARSRDEPSHGRHHLPHGVLSSLRSQTARDVFEAFTVFERQVAHVELKRLIFAAPFARIPQHAWALDACSRIRRHLGDLVDTHRGPDGAGRTDIAADVIAARDHDTGQPFSRDELIDQLGVLPGRARNHRQRPDLDVFHPGDAAGRGRADAGGNRHGGRPGCGGVRSHQAPAPRPQA